MVCIGYMLCMVYMPYALCRTCALCTVACFVNRQCSALPLCSCVRRGTAPLRRLSRGDMETGTPIDGGLNAGRGFFEDRSFRTSATGYLFLVDLTLGSIYPKKLDPPPQKKTAQPGERPLKLCGSPV